MNAQCMLTIATPIGTRSLLMRRTALNVPLVTKNIDNKEGAVPSKHSQNVGQIGLSFLGGQRSLAYCSLANMAHCIAHGQMIAPHNPLREIFCKKRYLNQNKQTRYFLEKNYRR